jgi:hypothetical protein
MTKGSAGEIIVVMQAARMTFAGAILVAVTASLYAPAAHANGRSAFSLRSFDYGRTAHLEPDGYGGQTFVDVNLWRVTVCTARPAHVRMRAIVESLDFGTQRFRFVRRQPAGCTRHRLRAENDVYPEQSTDSRLRVAWRNQRRHTRWLGAPDPAPD